MIFLLTLTGLRVFEELLEVDYLVRYFLSFIFVVFYIS
jgi:hypothetical protein